LAIDNGHVLQHLLGVTEVGKGSFVC